LSHVVCAVSNRWLFLLYKKLCLKYLRRGRTRRPRTSSVVYLMWSSVTLVVTCAPGTICTSRFGTWTRRIGPWKCTVSMTTCATSCVFCMRMIAFLISSNAAGVLMMSKRFIFLWIGSFWSDLYSLKWATWSCCQLFLPIFSLCL